MFLLLEMVCKTKVTLARVAQEKIKGGNAQRAKEAKGKIEKKMWEEKVKEKGDRKEEKRNGVRRGAESPTGD